MLVSKPQLRVIGIEHKGPWREKVKKQELVGKLLLGDALKKLDVIQRIAQFIEMEKALNYRNDVFATMILDPEGCDSFLLEIHSPGTDPKDRKGINANLPVYQCRFIEFRIIDFNMVFCKDDTHGWFGWLLLPGYNCMIESCDICGMIWPVCIHIEKMLPEALNENAFMIQMPGGIK